MKKLFVILILIFLITPIIFGQQLELLELIRIEMDKLKEELIVMIEPNKLFKGSTVQKMIIVLLDAMYLLIVDLIEISNDIK